jgi:cysteine synthase B
MNPFATIPIDERYRGFHERYPALNLIGNTRMVEILCFKEEFPEVSIYAKAEYANPGGSLKDRPVRRMLLEAAIAGEIGGGRSVLDSSSGNAGIAYAMIGAMMKIPVQIDRRAGQCQQGAQAAHSGSRRHTYPDGSHGRLR